ncbi:enoyl-CoA hydratase/carnithine racemase [Bradyrhizobium elkanii]
MVTATHDELERAAEMAFTGETIDAQQALAWNLVSRVVPHEQLMGAARGLAGRIAANASNDLRLTKRLMHEALYSRLGQSLELSAVFQAVSHKTADHSEALAASLEKRAPRFG